MELSAAVVSTKLDRMVRNELSLPISESFFWTDSTCVLWYIGNTTNGSKHSLQIGLQQLTTPPPSGIPNPVELRGRAS